MEALKFNTKITFNGLNSSLEIDLGKGIFFNIGRSVDVYKKLIKQFPKHTINTRIKLLIKQGYKFRAIALIKDYRGINIIEAKSAFDNEFK